MVKRIIGVLGTLGVVAIVAFTILGRAEYSSAIDFESEAAEQPIEVAPITEEQPLEQALEEADSLVIKQ